MWVVWSYGGGEIVLRGYDARTLAQVASVPVPAIGGVSNQALGVLAAGPAASSTWPRATPWPPWTRPPAR